jgi:hypothetical protein
MIIHVLDMKSSQNMLDTVTERILLKSFQEIQILFMYHRGELLLATNIF